MATKLSNIIGAPFADYVLRQLVIRASRSSVGVSGFDVRDSNEVLYMANKTAWVRLISSVDLAFPPGTNNSTTDYSDYLGKLGVLGSGEYSTEKSLAQNWVLEAGTSKQNGNGATLRQGLGTDGAYGLGGTSELGYRPMPGLTSVTIETAGRLGSLRTANINFKVWNMNQLNTVEALYFRLGYSMLLEWGHTQYYRNYQTKKETSTDNGFFVNKDIYGIDSPFSDNRRKEDIQQDIAKKKFETSGNYDGMLGVVVNFNWSYNQEGGYDCSVKLVGLGAVMDSIRINQIYKLPQGLLKKFRTSEENIKAFIDRRIAAGIKQVAATSGGTITAIDPIPANIVQLRQREQTYDDFPTTSTDAQFTATYGARSARNLGANAIGSRTADNAFDYYSTFTGTGTSAALVQAAQQAYGNGLFLNGRPGGFVFVKANSPITLDTRGLSLFASALRGKDELKPGRPEDFLKFISYVDQNSSDFTAMFDYATGFYRKVYPTGGGASVVEGAVARDRPLSPLAPDFNYSVKDVVFFDGTKTNVYFKASWNVPSGDADFGTTRGEFITAIQDWYKNSKQATITSIEFTKSGNGEAKITGTFQVNLKTYYNNATVNLDSLVDDGTGKKVKLRDRLLALGGIQVETGTDRLYKTYTATITFETNNPGFILGGATVPQSTSASSNTPGSANNGNSSTTTPTTNTEQVDSALGFESALHAMLIVVQTISQAEATKKQYDKVPVIPVDLAADTKLFYESGVLNGVFDTGSVTAPTDFNLVEYAKKGFSSEIMSHPEKFVEINYVGGTVTTPGFKNICKSVVVKYIQHNIDELQYPGQYQVYIPLGYLLAFMNNMCLFYDSKQGSTTASTDKRPYVYIDFNPETNFCLTTPQQFSIDPNVCLIPAFLGKTQYQEIFPEGAKPTKDAFDTEGKNTVSKILQEGTKGIPLNFSFQSGTAYRGKTMNIMLCTQYLLRVLKDYSTSDPEHAVALQPFLERVMADVNKALGNINLFRVAYRDDTNTIQIQDDQYVPHLPGEDTVLDRKVFLDNLKTNVLQSGQLPIFSSQIPDGRGNIISVPSLGIAREMQLRTALSGKMASMIAISAQAATGSVNAKDHSSLSWLNQNFRDRYKPYIQDPTNGVSGTNSNPSPNINNKKNQTTPVSNDQKLADLFNAHVKSVYSNLNLSEDAIEPMKNYYIERMSKVKSGDGVTASAPFIPAELEITLDGISGIIMGNAFNIPQSRLPLSLRGDDGFPKVGFIVNGLTHVIENNEWTTRLKGQMIKLREQSGLGKTIITPQGPQTGAVVASPGPSSIGTTVVGNTGPAGPPAGTVSVKIDRTDPNNACYVPPWVSQNKTVNIDPNGSKGKTFLNEYRPAFPAGSTKGYQGILEGQVWVEGYRPGTVAYSSNNPGNIGTNTNAGAYRVNKFNTLTEGIQAQINLLDRVIAGTSNNYPADPTLYEYITRYDPPCFRNKTTNQFERTKSTPEEVSSYTNIVLAFLRELGITGVDGNTKLSVIVSKN